MANKIELIRKCGRELTCYDIRKGVYVMRLDVVARKIEDTTTGIPSVSRTQCYAFQDLPEGKELESLEHIRTMCTAILSEYVGDAEILEEESLALPMPNGLDSPPFYDFFAIPCNLGRAVHA